MLRNFNLCNLFERDYIIIIQRLFDRAKKITENANVTKAKSIFNLWSSNKIMQL